MATRNPYAMDPGLMAGFSNLSRALLGSAQDDASIAQANLANTRGELVSAQTATEEALLDPRTKEILANVLLKEAQANTSGQQGNFFSSQTVGQNIANTDDQNQLDAFNALSSDPAMMQRVEQMIGAPGVDASALVRAMFNLDSNSQQVQTALAGVGTDADNQTARTIQLDPNSSELDILKAMAITDPAAFGSITNNNLDNQTSRFNNAANNTQSGENNAANNTQSGQNNAANNTQSGQNNAANNTQSGENNAANNTQSGQNNAANNTQSGQNNAANNTQSGNNNAANNTQSGQNNAANNTQSGENNAANNTQSGQNNAANNTQSGKNNAATNTQSGNNNAATNQTNMDIAELKQEVGSENYTEFLEQYAITVNKYGSEMMELPLQAMGWLEKTAMQAIRDDMKEDPSIIYGDAFNQNAVPMVAAGHMKVTFGYNFLFPKFVFDMHLRDGNRDQLLISAKEMGYAEEQIVNLGKQFDDARE